MTTLNPINEMVITITIKKNMTTIMTMITVLTRSVVGLERPSVHIFRDIHVEETSEIMFMCFLYE